jgi:zinc transport system substrate-binding protein
MENPRLVVIGLWLICVLRVMPALPAASLQVFVSIPPQKFFVERIGGDRVEVSVMLEPGHVPETYEPPPRKMAAMQSTRLYLLMNVPFERAWKAALPAQGPAFSVVDTGPRGGEQAEHPDPHAWVSPEDATRIARAVRDALRDADPSGARFYSDACERLLAELHVLDGEVRELLDRPRTPYFIISHASLGRFADAYGLRQIALEEGGKEAGPRRLTEIISLARREGIRTVFVQSQYHSGAARTLARELGAEIVEIDPLAENYPAAMRAIARAISHATR